MLMSNGCVVRSIYPWLGDDTKVSDTNLLGAWYDSEEEDEAFITRGDHGGYRILLTDDGKYHSTFTGSLHEIDATRFLVVGPADRDDLLGLALLPGYLLFKVEVTADRFTLWGLELDTFETLMETLDTKRLEEGGSDEGYVLFSTTTELEAFVESQASNPSFFYEEPVYAFKRIEPVRHK